MNKVSPSGWESEPLSAPAKVLRVLEYVAKQGGSTVAEVCNHSGMPKSTVVRILATLVDEKLLYRSDSSQYIPAIKLWELGCYAVGWDDTRDIVPPILKELVKATNETAHYAVYDHGRAVYIEKVDGSHPVRAYTRVGGSSPAYATATGKALLSWQSEIEIRETLVGAKTFTPTTIINPEVFIHHTEEIRHLGYSTNRGEWRSGVWGVAAPVFDRRHDVIGAVGLSGPSERFETEVERYAFFVMEAAREISEHFGARLKIGYM